MMVMQARPGAPPALAVSDAAQTDALEDGRLAAGLLLDCLASLRPLAGNDVAAQLVLASVGLGHDQGFEDDPAREPAPGPAAPVSGYAVALRLGFSRETVRRKLLGLMRRGLIAWTAAGYAVPRGTAASPLFHQSLRDAYRLAADYFRAMERLDQVGGNLRQTARREAANPQAASRALAAFAIDVLEAMGRVASGDLKETLILCAVFRDMDRPSPGKRPRQGSIAARLAAELGFSRETARRHIRALEAAGLVEGGAVGLRVSAAALQSRRLRGALARAGRGRLAFLDRLARAGVLAEP